MNIRRTCSKFTELDLNKDGHIEGDGLLQLAEWLLKISLVNETAPSQIDIVVEKGKMLQRFDKGLEGSLIMREVALLYEEAEVIPFLASYRWVSLLDVSDETENKLKHSAITVTGERPDARSPFRLKRFSEIKFSHRGIVDKMPKTIQTPAGWW